MSYEFMECENCKEKPGMSVLCNACFHNQRVTGKLQLEKANLIIDKCALTQNKKKLEAYYERLGEANKALIKENERLRKQRKDLREELTEDKIPEKGVDGKYPLRGTNGEYVSPEELITENCEVQRKVYQEELKKGDEILRRDLGFLEGSHIMLCKRVEALEIKCGKLSSGVVELEYETELKLQEIEEMCNDLCQRVEGPIHKHRTE